MVEVISEQVGDNAILRVVDNGSGIPPESREDVLRPLVRLRKDIPGAGLGLAVCVRIAAAHGGTLRIDERTRRRHGGDRDAPAEVDERDRLSGANRPDTAGRPRSSVSWSDERGRPC